jgi:hypothetical protein
MPVEPVIRQMLHLPGKSPFRSSLYPSYAIVVIAVLLMTTNFLHQRWTRVGPGERGVIHWDVISYYSYLPATFIYGDVTLGFLDHPPEGFVNDDKFWPSTLENGNRLIITSMGLSVLYAPFFFMAHMLAPVFGEAADGFSSIYQFFLVISALVYVVLGFVILKNLLLRSFRPLPTAITLIAIALGTNLLYYTTYEAAMAHSYGFFLAVLLLLLVIRWYERPTLLHTILTGALLGFIALVRPTNIVLVLLLILWDVRSWKGFLKRFRLVLLMLAAFVAVWVPQFIYWKAITGQWLYFTYSAEGASFYWGHPHIWQSLFGFKKGWFIYTPMMLLAVAGIPLLRKRVPGLFIPLLVLLIAMVYVQSSWWSWWFGGGFGLRAYIDIYGLLAVPLAAVVERILAQGRRWVRVPALSVIGLLLVLQLINTYQYTQNIIHYVGMNRYTYLRSFLRFHYHPDHWTHLTMPDYVLARKGIYVFYLTGNQYDYLAEMDREEALDKVREMIGAKRRLTREIGWYAKRTGTDFEAALSEVTERMYLSMTKK